MCDCIDSLLGSPFTHQKMLRALLITSRFTKPSERWTSEFDDYIEQTEHKKTLLDHIFVSEALWQTCIRAGVCHAVFEKYTEGTTRQLRPSDHRPVIADIL